MSERKLSPDLLRGHTDTMILKLLLEADCYGYQLIKLIVMRSEGAYALKEATMYSALHRLEASGDISWYWGMETEGGRRKYFKVTPQGRETYAQNKENWVHVKKILDHLL